MCVCVCVCVCACLSHDTALLLSCSLQVNKLVSELDTLHRSSEQQLKKVEQGGKPAINTAEPAELIKEAKKLPELRVREKTCLPLSFCTSCVYDLSLPPPPLPPLPLSLPTLSPSPHHSKWRYLATAR